ncbi:hypothetical protein [Deinococcus misasensis]|uniref:hypothetical protein n=1 Tax=Deinococcus misasensis TaxID=392413 RepID=UPI000552175A|nr:hypothetical protein [Deinococcus misasensis]
MKTTEEIKALLTAINSHNIYPMEIEELGRKHYGTMIITEAGTQIKLWHIAENPQPSTRELAEWDGSPLQGELTALQYFWEECCDSHWESQADLDLATLIVEAPSIIQQLLNRIEELETKLSKETTC